MGEWWSTWLSYRPGDFLMFAPRTYWRLFELANGAAWPAPLAGWAAGAAALWAGTASRAGIGRRAALAVLALAWACSGVLFLAQRFAPIYGVAGAWAWAFGAGAGLLLALALRREAVLPAAPGARHRVALALGVAALLLPLAAPADGRPWAQAELFGLAPDPTVLLTLAVLLVLRAGAGWARWALRALWTIAVAWCLHSAALLATMGSLQAALPLLGSVAALATCWTRRAGRRGG